MTLERKSHKSDVTDTNKFALTAQTTIDSEQVCPEFVKKLTANRFAASYLNASVQIWEKSHEWKLIQTVQTQNNYMSSMEAFSGNVIVGHGFGGNNSSVIFYKNGQYHHKTMPTKGVCVPLDGIHVAESYNNTLTIWDWSDLNRPVICRQFNTDGKIIFRNHTKTNKYLVCYLWDEITFTIIRLSINELLSKSNDQVSLPYKALRQFNPNHNFHFATLDDIFIFAARNIQLWSLDSCKLLDMFNSKDYLFGMSTANGYLITWDMSISFWDIYTRKREFTQTLGFNKYFRQVEVLPSELIFRVETYTTSNGISIESTILSIFDFKTPIKIDPTAVDLELTKNTSLPSGLRKITLEYAGCFFIKKQQMSLENALDKISKCYETNLTKSKSSFFRKWKNEVDFEKELDLALEKKLEEKERLQLCVIS